MAFSLLNPSFRIEWQTNSKEVTETVLNRLQFVAAPIRTRSKGGKRRRKPKTKAAETIGDNGGKISEPISEEFTPCAVQETTSGLETGTEMGRKTFKESVVVGIANILRHLEQRKLEVAFFDRSLLHPAPVAQFIGAACVASGAHCICLDDLSETLASTLKVKSVAALGIIRGIDQRPEAIDSLIDMVKQSTKPVASLAQNDDANDGPTKRKRKKNAHPDTSSDAMAETNYVETTVLVRRQSKKKK